MEDGRCWKTICGCIEKCEESCPYSDCMLEGQEITKRKVFEDAQKELERVGVHVTLMEARNALKEWKKEHRHKRDKYHPMVPMTIEQVKEYERRHAAGELWSDMAVECKMSLSGFRQKMKRTMEAG